jgi:D-glycero-D-manno-heptose 1,7-bisphosphate phosphatase
MKKRIAVFLDRDGTISEEVGYINHIDRFKPLPRVAEAIRLINENSLLAVVVTNQAGVARGYFPESLINEVHEKLKDYLKREGAHLDGVYYCPHHPEVGPPEYRVSCNCRKPKTGMIENAAKDLNIDVKRSYMVGDKISDIEFAHKVGAKGIMVMTGYGRGELKYFSHDWKVWPDHIADDLYDAVKWILNQEGLL